MNNNGNMNPEDAQPPEGAENVTTDSKNGDVADTAESVSKLEGGELERAADAILNEAGEKPIDDVEALKAELAEARDGYIRAHAEMENLRKRTDRELINRSRYAISKFAESVLSVGDNMQRAIQAVPEDAIKDNPALASLVDGIKVTERELLNILERHDIKPIDAEGAQLDPNFHQAMFEIANPDVPAGTILQVVQTGYMIGDRLLRPAQVGVAKGGPKPVPVAAQTDVAVDAPIEPLDTSVDGDPGIGVDRSAGSSEDAAKTQAANDDTSVNAPAPGGDAPGDGAADKSASANDTEGRSPHDGDPIDI